LSLSRGVVSYGQEKIEFSFFYVDRKTLEIAVHPDQTIVIRSPLGINIEEIQKRVVRRAAWIMKQRAFFRQFDPRTPVRRYVGGETHLYLGKHYRLRIRKGNQDIVKLIKGFFEIRVQGCISAEKAKDLLEGWYKEKAARQFNESIDRCWPYVEKFSSTKPRLKIKPMQKRWGSLSAKGRLTLNTDLIKAPKECIDYVIVHELSHLRYDNHGTEFYKFLDKVMPDWEKRKHRLEITLA
jgi:predicted metal-dependent hydrolase